MIFSRWWTRWWTRSRPLNEDRAVFLQEFGQTVMDAYQETSVQLARDSEPTFEALNALAKMRELEGRP